MSNPDRLTRNIRYRPTNFAIVGAGATVNNLLVTPDDTQRRIVTGIAATLQAISIRYQVIRAGYLAAEIDASVLNLTQGFYQLDLEYPVGIQIQITEFNNSVGASVAGVVVVRYELPDAPGPA